MIKGVDKNNGVRVPKIPKQKTPLIQEASNTGNAIMPKTLKQQKAETKKILKTG